MNTPPLNCLKVCVDGEIHKLNASLAAGYGSKLIYNVWQGKLKALELLKYSLKSMTVPYTEDIITIILPDGKTEIIFRAKAYLLDLVEYENVRLINYVAIGSIRSYSIIEQKDYFKLDLATIIFSDTSESK